MKTIVSIFCIILIIFLLSGVIWAYFTDKKEYNKGICPKCGKPLELMDVDSQGGRWYACTNRYNKENPCDYDCWITHDVDNYN